jgi:homoserine O-acetyltransferase
MKGWRGEYKSSRRIHDINIARSPVARYRISVKTLIYSVVSVIAVTTMSCAPRTARVLLDPSAAIWTEPVPSLYSATIETTKGTFVVRVPRDWAPLGADRFYRLARAKYYDDSRFTRVVPKFIAQFGVAGDPAVARLWYDRTFPDDSVRHSNVRGTIGFADTGPGKRTTQLYINLVDNTRLDAQGFAPIGYVASGMDVVDSLYSGYGENAGGGVRAGHQGPVVDGGNAYVDGTYPKLENAVIPATSEPHGCHAGPPRHVRESLSAR